jgi:hypothetical protein
MRLNRNNHMAGIYLTDIHKGKRISVFIYQDGGCFPINDFTENTIAHELCPQYKKSRCEIPPILSGDLSTNPHF